jgi:acyl carrier protein
MSGSEVTDAALCDQLLKLVTSHLRRVPADVDWATAQLPDLGLDSMSAIELVLAIEDVFGAQFPEESLVRETFATFGTLETVVRAMVVQP